MNGAASGLLFLLLALFALEGPEWILRRRGAGRAPRGLLRRVAFEAWASGVLASHLFVVRALARPDQGVEAIGREMVLSLLPSLAGLAIAAIAGMRALGRAEDDEPPPGDFEPARRTGWIGGAVLAALVGAVLVVSSPAGGDPRLSPVVLLLHVPALLVFAGAAVLLLRVAGPGGVRAGTAPAIALAGALACTAGLVQALLGFTRKDLAFVTDGLSFVMTSGFVGILALVVAGRDAPGGDVGSPAARAAGRIAWALLPLADLLFLVVAIILAMTPMTAPG